MQSNTTISHIKIPKIKNEENAKYWQQLRLLYVPDRDVKLVDSI